MALNDVELAQITRSGEHFKKIIRDTLELLPRPARTVTGLARHTGVNKSTCQRLVQSLTKTKDGIDVILNLPGQTGLRQLSEAFTGLISSQTCLEEFDQLIEQYQDLILQFASSQSELKRLLLKNQNESSESFKQYKNKLKRTAFETNRELTGESVDLYAGIHYCRPNADDPKVVDELLICHRIGVKLSKGARPFVQAIAGNIEEGTFVVPQSVSGDNLPDSTDKDSLFYLLNDFSTPDVERCYAGPGNQRNSVVYNHILEPIECQKFDITLAFLAKKTEPNPMIDAHDMICQGLTARSPAKRLVMISLMSKEMDRGCRIQSGCYPSSAQAHHIGHNADDLWTERFNESPRIHAFNPQNDQLNGLLSLADINDLVLQGFEMFGEQPADFVGYFTDIEYPYWLASHRLYYEFS